MCLFKTGIVLSIIAHELDKLRIDIDNLLMRKIIDKDRRKTFSKDNINKIDRESK
jgi:hypothetical protein